MVKKDKIDEIAEDVDEIAEDVDELSEDVEKSHKFLKRLLKEEKYDRNKLNILIGLWILDKIIMALMILILSK